MIVLPAGSATGAAGKSPFGDAIAVWHMRDARDAGGKNSALTVKGDVKLGVELKGAERRSSLETGGDGRAAELRGGYLTAG
jgi:hypothetical protein